MEPLLRHLEDVGFAGAPRFLGVDERGRQVLSFVEGEVAGRPWPAWVADEHRLASVARLVRDYDDAALTFGVPASASAAVWPDPPGTPAPLPAPVVLLGHQDVTPENVVFVDGQASALIDFDMARPTDRVGEITNVLLW